MHWDKNNKLVKELENKICGEKLRELRLISLETKKLKGDLIILYNDPKGGYSEVEADFFS